MSEGGYIYGMPFPTEDEHPETSGESLLQELVTLRAEVARLRANPHQGTITALAEAARAVIGINTDEAEAVRRLVLWCNQLHKQLLWYRQQASPITDRPVRVKCPDSLEQKEG
jgi:hypothetical protein